MKQAEIKDLSTKDLGEKITETKGTLAKIRMNHAISPVDNPLKITTTRRSIARMLTELNNRKKAEAKK